MPLPSDANGVYSLPDGYLAVTGAPIQASQHNPPLEDLGSAVTGRLPRSGVAPMTGPLRVPDGTADTPTLAFASDPSAGFYLSGGKIIPTKPLSGVFPTGLGPLPWPGKTAPPLWVLVYGQTLLRASYPDLWTFAQAEIAQGSTFFNNGDGSTTFGIGDARGYVFAGADSMGGVAANRLPGYTVWAKGGTASVALATDQVAPHLHTGRTGDDNPDHSHPTVGPPSFEVPSGANGPIAGTYWSGSPVLNRNSGGASTRHQHDFVTNTGNGVVGNPHPNIQPTYALNFIMYAGA